ncbi:TlpA family protein disulfide reductase [Catellatospora sichuanensis]|uniref:TlpA family protein disulfide reductase n=1 Tax=Catellatospora sichuanensis TaxID=1969805 RepID=UPI0011827070|nr:TlpA disulfide reductase family protein [Catellatospora sichuanensis]
MAATLLAACTGPGEAGPDGTVPQPFAACTPFTGGVTTTAPAVTPEVTGSPAPDAASARPAVTSPSAIQGAVVPTTGNDGPIATLPTSAAPRTNGTASTSSAPTPRGRARVISLPELTLECMAGGDAVRLSTLRGPLVINLWASWCAPCRQELPAFQRLADSGRVPVLGVVTEDGRDAAAWLADELKVSLPSVYDRSGGLKAAVGENLLPLTLFVGADGRASVYRDVALTDQTLAQLVEHHFGRP